MKIRGGVNLEFLLNEFSFDKANSEQKQGFVLEGGSGSGKTYDIINFLLIYCQTNYNKNKDILIFRETFADLRKTVLKDFEKILRAYNLFDDATTKMLFYKIDKEYWSSLITFLVFLGRMPQTIDEYGINTSDYALDETVLEVLRKI